MLKTGTMIGGKYEILKLIGKGGMSHVYLVMDREGKKYAMKEIEKKENAFHSAMAEVKVLKKLDHPLLPQIELIIDQTDVFYVVMDYIEGQPLSSILKEKGARPQKEVIRWAKDLCRVLHYLHTQKPPIIYRDMKPANIMLLPDGNIKLIDFGIAREYKEQHLEDTVCLGTRGYAAPEQFFGKGQTDRRTDIYGMGATLYHLLTGDPPGNPPYRLPSIGDCRADVSGRLEKIIRKCTQINPEDRYQSCMELLEDLNNCEKTEKKRKNHPHGIAKMILLLLAALIWYFVLRGVEGSGFWDKTEQIPAQIAVGIRMVQYLRENMDYVVSYGKYCAAAFICGAITNIILLYLKRD